MERKAVRRKEGGFTLIELIIVVAIIAIMIGGVVFFGGAISKDAKVSKAEEMASKIATAVQSCKLKGANLSGIDSLAKLSNMVSDSQCRLDATDGQGLIAGGVPANVSGVNIDAAYDNTKNGLVLKLNPADQGIADELTAKLQEKFGAGNVTKDGTEVDVLLK